MVVRARSMQPFVCRVVSANNITVPNTTAAVHNSGFQVLCDCGVRTLVNIVVAPQLGTCEQNGAPESRIEHRIKRS